MAEGGALIALGWCVRCRQAMTFDPATVPSIWCDIATGLPAEPYLTVRGDNGEERQVEREDVARQPLCRDCAPVVRAEAEAGIPTSWPAPWGVTDDA